MNEFMRIGDICDILNGYAFKSSKYVADGIRVIRITNVQKGFVEDTNPQYYPVSEQREIEKYMLCEGDLLMSLTGNVGRVGLLSAEMLPAALNQRVACIRIRNPAVIYKPFLFHLLNSDYFENKCILASQGVAQKNMSTEWLKEYPIPSFSMDKQMEIASIFDKIDDLIARRKEQVRNMDQAVKSRFIELFGDPIDNTMGLKTMPLGEACFLKAGITTAADAIHEQSAVYPVPCYGGNGIRGYVKEATQHGCYPIIGRQGALCGNVQMATGEFHATEHAVLVTPLIETNVVWLFHLLRMMDLYRFHTGAAQPGLAVKTLNTVDIPIAEIAVQNNFAAFVEQTDKSKLCGKMEAAA